MSVLVATTTIGHLSPVESARLVADAWAQRAPGTTVERLPMSAGGVGFVDAVEASLGGRRLVVPVPGPDGEERPATVLVVSTRSGPVAYVEAAEAAPGPYDGTLQSYGVGRLLRAARDAGARRIVVGVGDLAALDGGAGMLRGVADSAATTEYELPAHLDAVIGDWSEIELVAAVDHDTPLVGAQGATYGLLGVDSAEAQSRERAMGDLIDAVERVLPPRRDLLSGLPVRLHRVPGAGAGGGLAYGLSVLGAQIRNGAEVLAHAVGLADRVRAADVVVTGETTYDWRSLEHSVVATVSGAAAAAARPVVMIARDQHVGRRESMALGIAGSYSVIPSGRLAPATPTATDLEDRLAALVGRVAGTWTPPGADDVH
ncbi:glycerate kinase [Luteipulveratus halotolerans]|uniref:Glycerate kinase n=1 Tax=Luteipulveratus halotolerans TaxID=1631356 RepID=A0A0L6CHF8_9MICO|nr:glycerate kinase [Luteipulveratus halotolerans]KNX36938.1 hypothetical protein VV01_06880 [Luteipulveratus halotolerans]